MNDRACWGPDYFGVGACKVEMMSLLMGEEMEAQAG